MCVMAAKICQKINSYFWSLNPKVVEGGIIAGCTGLSWYFAGIPSAIITLGGYLAARQFLPFSRQPAVELSARQVTASPAMFSAGNRRFRLSDDMQLAPPLGELPITPWENNSCFLASSMKAFFLNEPAVLAELPVSIKKRLEGSASILDKLVPTLNLNNRVEPLTKNDFKNLCENLQILEGQGNLPADAAPLLSLLELYFLIDICQRNNSVAGSQINTMRAMAYRVNKNFEGINDQPGDPSEVIGILADLIFEGSSLQRECITTRIFEGNGQEKRELHQFVANWGRLELKPVLNNITNISVQESLQNFLTPPVENGVKYGTSNYDTCQEINRFTSLPELLVLTMALYDTPTEGLKIIAEPTLELNSLSERGCYELYGVLKRVGGHYQALVKRGKGSYYFCDDDFSKSVSSNEFLELAETGYAFIYRKVASQQLTA